MKLLKFIAATLGVLLLVVATGALLLVMLVNPNNFKPQISEFIKQKTGRELTINGQIHWSFLPTLGVTADDVRLDNIATAKSLTVRAELMPLIKRQLEISSVAVNQATVRFKEQNITLSELDASSRNISLNKDFPITAKFKYTDKSHTNLPIELSTRMRVSQNAQQVTLTKLRLQSQEYADVRLELRSDLLELNTQKMAVKSDAFVLSLADLVVAGNMLGQNLGGVASWQGKIKTNHFNPRTVAKALGNELNFKNKAVFADMRLEANLETRSGNIMLTDVRANIDDKFLTGSIDFNAQVIDVNLDTNKLDVSDFAMAQHAAEKPTASTSKPNKNSPSKPHQSWVVKANVAVNSLTTPFTTFTGAKGNLQYQNKTLQVNNFSANVFDGQTRGNFTINFNNTTQFNLKQTLSNVDAAAMQRAFNTTPRLKGRASITTQLTFASNNPKGTLSGSASINMSRGTLVGVDLDHQLSKAIGKLDPKRSASRDTGNTEFNNFTSNMSFNRGAVNNPSFSLNTNQVRVRGSGQTHLVSHQLDYRVDIRALRSIDINSEVVRMDLAEYDIPAKVTGTWEKPNVSLSISSILQQAAKKQVQKVIEKQVEDRVDDVVKDLGDKVKDIFKF